MINHPNMIMMQMVDHVYFGWSTISILISHLYVSLCILNTNHQTFEIEFNLK